MSGKGATGQKGEELAVNYLVRRGCIILDRNWRANPGEVDIVARCPGPEPVLAFVEVRTRHGRTGLAEESISRRKAQSMLSAAYAYMEAHGVDVETVRWRIDLVAVAVSGTGASSINWVQGAIDESMIE